MVPQAIAGGKTGALGDHFSGKAWINQQGQSVMWMIIPPLLSISGGASADMRPTIPILTIRSLPSKKTRHLLVKIWLVQPFPSFPILTIISSPSFFRQFEPS